MFTSFLKITLRNLYREKMYAFINIFGLSVAIACCIILGLYLRSELTYDRHNTRHREIYRVVNEFTVNGKADATAVTSFYLGPLLAQEFPEIKEYVRFMTIPQKVMYRHGDKAFYWENHFTVDDNIFDVFDHDIIYGDPKTALADWHCLAVSETFAKKYFGDANPIGESIKTINAMDDQKITLVFADLPENSHMKYDALSSFNNPAYTVPDNAMARQYMLWSFAELTNSPRNYTYLVLPEDYDVQDWKERSESFFARHMAETGNARNATWTSWLQPLTDIHLHSDVGSDRPTANKPYLYAFTAVAIFILLVACINYMNLTTARAAKRAKEVGIQKILGSGRVFLVVRFLFESVLFSFLALFLGLVLVELAFNLTPISTLLDKPMSLDLLGEPGLLGWIIGFVLLLGLLSGSYPAFYLSSIMPLPALVSGLRAGKRNIQLRHLLVLIQFVISVGIIACTLLMMLQIRYVSNKSLGFDKENRVTVTLRGADIIEKIPTITKELSKDSRILGISTLSNLIGQPTEKNTLSVENNDGVLETMVLDNMAVGNNFLEVMGMQLTAGRDLSKRLLTDVGTSFVVNEALVNKMGWQEPIGKHITIGQHNGRVVGVVKNFHFASLHSKIEPLALYQYDENETLGGDPYIQRFLVLNIAGENISSTLSDIESVVMSFGPNHPFIYEFLDDALDRQYVSERHMMKLIGIFAGICILISCLGLFALSAFTTEQRTKEIGVRKVMGASTGQIILLLFKKILLLVISGAVVASLLAYYAIDEWLASFAYRTGIPLWVFFLSAAVTACVAFVTVASQSYKTARANPVKALRYE